MKWPGAWLRDYTFWRDVVSTAIGGLLVLMVAFIWAVLMGYLTSPGLWQAIGSFFGAISISAVAPALAGAVALIVSISTHRMQRTQAERAEADLWKAARKEKRRRDEEGDEPV